MKEKVSKRLNRILLLVPYLSSPDGAPTGALCKKFGITREELMEDMHILFICGVPEYTPYDLIGFDVENDRIRVYQADYFSRPLRMTREEAMVLLVSGRALIRAGIFEENSSLATALDKVESTLTALERKETKDMAERIQVELELYSGKWSKVIEKGINNGRNLVIDYYSYSSGEMSEREIEPVSLVFSRGHWYLLAWCHKAGDMRYFRMDRIGSVKISRNRSTKRQELESQFPQTVGEYRAGRKSHRVKLIFERNAGRRMVEECPTAIWAEKDSSTIEVELQTRNLFWLSNYIIKFGNEIGIESPPELKELVRERSKQILEIYRV
ncbi:MAG: WYL domain-containing protein [Actinomycetota bacterium]|nr:WYL domain-containing protein [Actinomycetota bacterium]